MLEWKTNFTNPYKALHTPIILSGESYLDALRRERELYDRLIKGRPQATDTYTVEQLEAMGMIGLYEQKEEA